MTSDDRALRRPTVAVVGAGISGLAAAWQLATTRPDVDLVVLEGSAAVGGKLALGSVAGVSLDLGAESVLARRSEATDLAREVGLGDDLVSPRAVGASIWSRGELHPLPAGTLMGVPGGAAGLSGLLAPSEVARVEAERVHSWPALAQDVDVASFVADRVGAAVVDRLVEPLLGGVYAGRASNLSLEATVPALWQAAAAGRSVVDCARSTSAAGAASRGPVFAGVRGGVGRLPLAVREALEARGRRVRVGVTVRELVRRPAGWRLVTGPTSDPRTVDVDAVVLATPAAPTSRLLRDVAPSAADDLRSVDSASVAIVTLALDRSLVHGLAGSGVLVPPVDDRYIKAATFSSSKWPWLDDAGGQYVLVRASVGRHGQVGDLQLSDDEVVRLVLADLRALPGVQLPPPVDTLVTRWGGGLPQYAVGHVARLTRVLAAVEQLPGLELAGAAYEGVGVPACVASGRAAARRLATHLDLAGSRYGTMGA